MVVEPVLSKTGDVRVEMDAGLPRFFIVKSPT
jgi:hypothetical protein